MLHSAYTCIVYHVIIRKLLLKNIMPCYLIFCTTHCQPFAQPLALSRRPPPLSFNLIINTPGVHQICHRYMTHVHGHHQIVTAVWFWQVFINIWWIFFFQYAYNWTVISIWLTYPTINSIIHTFVPSLHFYL